MPLGLRSRAKHSPLWSEKLQEPKELEEHRFPIALLVHNVDASPEKLQRRQGLLMDDRIDREWARHADEAELYRGGVVHLGANRPRLWHRNGDGAFQSWRRIGSSQLEGRRG